MRLHELSVTAFGPFVDTVRVDFDELSSGGLFLLTGDTGAGKTSVLDAVCFALYGEVPGDRHTARHLRSDLADPSAEPRIQLRFSVGERTFRFTRSPAWDRPRTRGEGTRRIQAHVVAEEQREGEWCALTNRLDEAGQLVTALLGMTCTQFTQVAMLPQGRFQAFLRASSSERHAVLQRLFRTGRFEDVERWLVDRRLTLGRDCRRHHDVAAGVVNRLQESAGVTVPGTWDVQDLDTVADDGSLERWAHDVTDVAQTALAARQDELELATTTLARDASALDQARTTAEARTRGESAQRRVSDLDESLDDEAALVATLDAHRRAAPILPQTLRVETAQGHHAEAAARAAEHLAMVRGLVRVEVDADSVVATLTRLGEERAVAESWLPRERQVKEERARLKTLATATADLGSRVADHQARATELAAARQHAATALGQAEALAQRAAADQAAVDQAQAGLEAAADAASLTVELTEARDRLSQATSHAQGLRQTYLDLREQRISGMAAELAGGLAVGCSCPVCGSIEHPAPAAASAGVSRADEDTAHRRYESADFERQSVHELVATLSTQLQAALVRSNGHGVTHWRLAATTALAAAATSSMARRDAARLRLELTELEREDQDVTTELATARVALEERTRERDEVAERHARLVAELDALLTAHPGVTTVSALVAALRSAVSELEEARSALTTRDRAAHELALATDAAEAAAKEAGFGSLADALAAVLPGREAVTRARRLDERRSARAAAEAVLTEEAVRTALAVEPPDLETLAAALAASGRVRDAAHAAHDLATRRVARLDALVEELSQALAAWAPVREARDLTASLAALVEGKSADNRLRMRLSAYVLSERLRQVVAAANERLGAMTDERYTLVQADEKGAGEQRGGLSLRVRDEWTAMQRDPATLSGGETFLVSLALALGLADTVSHEAGGTQLDTLFIDEGFGALDATTLDTVMDTLDALRDGGRVVGLVSHVAELRNRVPTQLEVRKGRRGSTLSPARARG